MAPLQWRDRPRNEGTMIEEIKSLLFAKDLFRGRERDDRDVADWNMAALAVLLRAELARSTPAESYADRADSATSFDPELQSDGDAERQANTIHIEKNP